MTKPEPPGRRSGYKTTPLEPSWRKTRTRRGKAPSSQRIEIREFLEKHSAVSAPISYWQGELEKAFLEQGKRKPAERQTKVLLDLLAHNFAHKVGRDPFTGVVARSTVLRLEPVTPAANVDRERRLVHYLPTASSAELTRLLRREGVRVSSQRVAELRRQMIEEEQEEEVKLGQLEFRGAISRATRLRKREYLPPLVPRTGKTLTELARMRVISELTLDWARRKLPHLV